MYNFSPFSVKVIQFWGGKGMTINDNDMLSYSLTTMMCFVTKE